MQYYIDTNSGVPIYVQLKNQIKESIAGGVLKPGQRLPSVRELALELTINPNTVARVYKELEQEGLIKTKRGAGSFVAQKPEFNEKIAEKEIEKALDRLMTRAYQLGIDSRTLLKKFKRKLKNRFEQKKGDD